MSTVAAEMNGFEGPFSPELVLVSPPELAALARQLLPQSPFVLPVPLQAERSPSLGLGFVAFAAVCLVATVGPLLLAILARIHH
jgi:hypothetical protein